MKRFETIGQIKDEPVSVKVHNPEIDTKYLDSFSSLEEIKDYLFDEFLKQNLLDDFVDSLVEYFDETEIQVFREVMHKLPENSFTSLLSLPYELRPRAFSRLREVVDDGGDLASLIENLAELSTKGGYSIGYHTSPIDIRPDESGRWEIKGTENDHRDNDIPMAYYSSKYRHLFKKKNPRFVYLIRSDQMNHKTDGNWSRGASLSVIARVPFEKVTSYVENTANEKAAHLEKEAA